MELCRGLFVMLTCVQYCKLVPYKIIPYVY
jgi:hypothetical protein